jgi:glutamate racemase
MKAKKNSPIGVFDSGIGGLTVLKEINRVLPAEGTIYLGDTARVPYGSKSGDTVTRYSLEIAKFLVKQGIKLLVVACNTASAISIETIKKESPVPVIGVIDPGARAAIHASTAKRIGVIGTNTTIKSNTYLKAMKELDKGVHVFAMPCPLFVPLIEEGWIKGKIAVLIAKKYLRYFKDKKIDTLLLGCTHYPLLKPVLSEVMGDRITLVDSAIETGKEIKRVIKETGLERKSEIKPLRRFYVTDSPERFINVGERFLGQKIKNINKINVGG